MGLRPRLSTIEGWLLKEVHHDLILLGQGPSMNGCPFDAEVWTTVSVLSHKGFENKPYTKLFLFDLPEAKVDETQGMEVAQTKDIPIVGFENASCITEPYPLGEINKKFDTHYFFNDMSYMIALALYNGYKSLLLWGVDQGREYIYTYGRSYIMYWLGMATGMGVEWELAPDSILLRDDD